MDRVLALLFPNNRLCAGEKEGEREKKDSSPEQHLLEPRLSNELEQTHLAACNQPMNIQIRNTGSASLTSILLQWFIVEPAALVINMPTSKKIMIYTSYFLLLRRKQIVYSYLKSLELVR